MRRIRSCAALLLCLSFVAACGDDDEEPEAADTTASTTAEGEAAEEPAELTGEPIKIGVVGVVESQISMPWVPEAAEVAAAAVNADGGIDGRPIEIVFCDHQGTPEGASVCAQRLLEEEQVLLLAGGEGFQDGALLPAVTAADTILWATAGAHPDSLPNERSYLLHPLLVANWGIPQLLPEDVDTFAYVSADTAVAREGRERTIQFFPPEVTVERIDVPLTATDFQPFCLTVRESGAQAVLTAFNPLQIPTMMQTCTQVGLQDITWVVPSSVITPEVLDMIDELQLENLSVQAFSSSAYEALAADNEEFGDEVGAISNPVADQAVLTWLGIKLLPQIIEAAGAVDGAAIRAYLDQQTAFDTGGATPPLDFTTAPIPTLPRIRNLTPFGGQWADGGVEADDEPLEIDVSVLGG